MRKIIQIANALAYHPKQGNFNSDEGCMILRVHALCDDGTVWRSTSKGWERLHNIPQDKQPLMSECPAYME
jgi:hypothetical protein